MIIDYVFGWSYLLMVRKHDFHSCNSGSIPDGTTKHTTKKKRCRFFAIKRDDPVCK